MMKHEFIERTGYTPTDEEYHYIEESYYEAETCSKDEFCKQWLKDNASGKWSMELRFRKMLDEQKAEYEAKLREKEDDLNWYREAYKALWERAEKLSAIEKILKG